MKKNKTLALVGAGNWGKNLLRHFYQMGTLHTLCESNEERLNQYKQQFPDIHMETELHPILLDPSITQVAIATPSIHHFGMAKLALLANKDVYVEKPITLNVKDCLELRTLADQRKQILMVGHILHYHPSLICLKKMIQEGMLGEIQQFYSNRLHCCTTHNTENVLWDLGPHDVSVMLSLIRQPLMTLSCSSASTSLSKSENAIVIRLNFANNIRVRVNLSRVHPYKEQRMSIIGSKGVVIFDDTKPWGKNSSFIKKRLHQSYFAVDNICRACRSHIPFSNHSKKSAHTFYHAAKSAFNHKQMRKKLLK